MHVRHQVILELLVEKVKVYNIRVSIHCCPQCHLDKEGASELVVDLVVNNHSSRIFLETIELGIALLEGGNSVIQV